MTLEIKIWDGSMKKKTEFSLEAAHTLKIFTHQFLSP